MQFKQDEFITSVPDGWHKFTLFPDPTITSYIHVEKGYQVLFSIKDLGRIRTLHLSVGVITSLRNDLSEEELVREAWEDTPKIIKDFFGDRGFAMAPDDKRTPSVKHYFAMLD